MDRSTLTAVGARSDAPAPQGARSEAAPAAAVALVVRDGATLALRTLLSLAGTDAGASFQTVLVDDASADATPAVVAAVEGAFTAIRAERPLGFAAALDRAVAACAQPIVVALREDLVVTAGWLAQLLAPFADPAVGAVRPRVLDLAGREPGGACWPALALRRAAYDDVGGMAGSAKPGKAVKATLLEAIVDAGWALAHAPDAVLLWVPEAAARAAGTLES